MSAKKGNNNIPPDSLALYDELIKTNPAIERKGVKLPYTSFNGHMFTFLSESGVLAIRLPESEREFFSKTIQLVFNGVTGYDREGICSCAGERVEEHKRIEEVS